MNNLIEQPIDCPYCGQTIRILVEYLDDEQQYIEDCQVCCRPINFRVWLGIQGDANIVITHENE